VLQSAAAHAGPVHTVAAGYWQAARPLGGFALCGCTVGPGFEFDDFSFLRDEPALAARLRLLNLDAATML
jgi:predicted cupin superfamily sugar epimerase